MEQQTAQFAPLLLAIQYLKNLFEVYCLNKFSISFWSEFACLGSSTELYNFTRRFFKPE